MSAPDINEKTWLLLERAITASVQESRRQRRWNILMKVGTVAIIGLLFLSSIDGPILKIGSWGANPHTAVVRVEGDIIEGSRGGADMVVAGLRRAFESEDARAVILLINSPGGSPVQAGYINEEIIRLKGKYPSKRVYAVIRDIGASGAYYVAAAADEIYADKASIVGSIGVINSGFGFEEALKRVGVERRVFHAGDNKAFLDPFSPLNPSHVKSWQAVLKNTHAQFIAAVKSGRGERLLDTPEVFSGLVWNGKQAVQLGLVDKLGNAGYVAREVVKAETLVDYSVRPGPFSDLSSKIGTDLGKGIGSGLLSAVTSLQATAPVL